MSFARISLSLVGVVGIIAVALAGATIWLLVTQPVTTADAIGAATQGEVSPLVKALAGALYDALQGLLSTSNRVHPCSSARARAPPPKHAELD